LGPKSQPIEIDGLAFRDLDDLHRIVDRLAGLNTCVAKV
jgi:hypothetical protein